MHLEFSHKPNYYFFAQSLIRHFETCIKKHPDVNQVTIELASIGEIFRHDFAATTTNLEPILNICDEYAVETLNGDQKLIKHYKIHALEHELHIEFNQEAREALISGKPLIDPDASTY